MIQANLTYCNSPLIPITLTPRAQGFHFPPTENHPMGRRMNDASIKEELMRTSSKIYAGDIHPLLPQTLEQHFPRSHKKAFLLHMMPDQGGEVFWILVNKDTVAVIELPWHFLNTDPDISTMHIDEYRSILSGASRRRLSIAQNLMRKKSD